MSTNKQRLDDPDVAQLRRQGGLWLRELRERAGHTQRTLAASVGAEYYTFISQIENGRGRVPPERYRVWIEALAVDGKDFMKGIMRFYDPYAYEILYGELPQPSGTGEKEMQVA